ncbi:hypothetical protein IPZ58_31850 [Streptomyces roseoverticillatus]|uniref:hypothetical protein n=1 Tax=Streptomyces roseoverticillatus TaxID=66429 RepID=UPI001F26BBEA|nr:hypothetical protein [Streptomyces roseoverticillatus]MCF3106131.1 hypothetical protein [Streptomyces roseoverticillatus]
MTDIQDDFLSTARAAAALLREDAVAAAVGTVVALLIRLARRRHGTAADLRALARAERAPASIAAF